MDTDTSWAAEDPSGTAHRRLPPVEGPRRLPGVVHPPAPRPEGGGLDGAIGLPSRGPVRFRPARSPWRADVLRWSARPLGIGRRVPGRASRRRPIIFIEVSAWTGTPSARAAVDLSAGPGTPSPRPRPRSARRPAPRARPGVRDQIDRLGTESRTGSALASATGSARARVRRRPIFADCARDSTRGPSVDRMTGSPPLVVPASVALDEDCGRRYDSSARVTASPHSRSSVGSAPASHRARRTSGTAQEGPKRQILGIRGSETYKAWLVHSRSRDARTWRTWWMMRWWPMPRDGVSRPRRNDDERRR
jgi:hypothetical protein